MKRIDAAPEPIPTNLFEQDASFVDACKRAPHSLIYFLINVGDGDMQLVLLPIDPEEDPRTGRRAIVIDVATTNKLPRLIASLTEEKLLRYRKARDTFGLVIGTHPHDDHIGGMPQFLEQFKDWIKEYWDSGYFHPTSAYIESMLVLESRRKEILLTQPTSGLTRFMDSVKITVMTPGIGLRNRYDTYGVNINDASIAVKLEFPASRTVQQGRNREYVRPKEPWSLLLGADSQTTSWAQAFVDYPEVHTGERDQVGDILRETLGRDLLKSHIFKVPHHASKHGVNVELVERIEPKLALISSVAGGGRYHFPHVLAVEAIREGLQPTTSGQVRKEDHELGIHYTGARLGDRRKRPLGTVALIVPPKVGSKISLWRFLDSPHDDIDLHKAIKLKKP